MIREDMSLVEEYLSELDVDKKVVTEGRKQLREENAQSRKELEGVKRMLSGVQESLMNIRERNYLTFLRDHVTRFAKTNKD